MFLTEFTSQLVSLFQHTTQQPAHAAWPLLLLLAFTGGIVSSLLPCTLGMLPVMVGLIAGSADSSRQTVLLRSICFILGLSVVMTILGLLASSLGVALGSLLGEGWYWAIGILSIVIGLSMLEVLHLPLPPTLQRLPNTPSGNVLGPFALGLAFGSAASPCGTPFLTGILGLMSQQKQLALGAGGLFCYGLGQGSVLMAAGMFTGLLKQLTVLRHFGSHLNTVSGVLFIVTGILIVLQASGVLGLLLLQLGG